MAQGPGRQDSVLFLHELHVKRCPDRILLRFLNAQNIVFPFCVVTVLRPVRESPFRDLTRHGGWHSPCMFHGWEGHICIITPQGGVIFSTGVMFSILTMGSCCPFSTGSHVLQTLFLKTMGGTSHPQCLCTDSCSIPQHLRVESERNQTFHHSNTKDRDSTSCLPALNNKYNQKRKS